LLTGSAARGDAKALQVAVTDVRAATEGAESAIEASPLSPQPP
jgi:hypothetical protein